MNSALEHTSAIPMRKSSRGMGTRGMTLVEILISGALVALMIGLSLGMFTAFQKQFVLTNTWSEARASQVRVLQAMAMDLRSSGTVQATTSGGASVLPLTLYIHQRYTSYYTSGDSAGEPLRNGTANPVATPNASSEIVYPSGDMVVTYTASSSGGKYYVYRGAQWKESGVTKTGSRVIGSFPAVMSIALNGVSTTTGSSTGPVAASDTIVKITVSPPASITYGKGQAVNAMSLNVFLRQNAAIP